MIGQVSTCCARRRLIGSTSPVLLSPPLARGNPRGASPLSRRERRRPLPHPLPQGEGCSSSAASVGGGHVVGLGGVEDIGIVRAIDLDGADEAAGGAAEGMVH